MINLREFRAQAQRLSDYLPWAALIEPGVMLNKVGSFQATIRFRGPDVDSVTPHDLMALRARMNNVLRRLGSGWCVHMEVARRVAEHRQASAFPNATAQGIEEERQQTLSANPAYESTHFVTLTYLPPEDRLRRATNLLLTNPTNTDGNESIAQEHLEYFQREVTQFINMLSAFMPEVQRLDDDETLSYLHDCVSERRLSVKMPATPCYLDEFLTDSPMTGGLSPCLGRQFLKVISVHGYVNKTLPCLLDGLNPLPIEYRWVARYLPMDADEARKTLQRLQHHWFARRKSLRTLLKEFFTKTESQVVDTDALNKAEEVTEALEALGADCCAFGFFTLTITTWHEDERIATKNAQAIQRVCDGVGLVTRIENYNALQAWFGSLPGHAYADNRRPILSSLSLSDLIPISSVWPGAAQNQHLEGPALATVHTDGSTPFRLNLHHNDVGHTAIFGPPGSGKSTLLNFLACQFLRYSGAQVFYFDTGRSSQPMTLAMGGDFYDLSADAAGLSFQPLAELDREGELAWAHDWLLDILQRESVEITPLLKQELWASLTNVASMPPVHRTLTTLLDILQHQVARQALQNYVLGGAFGHLFDSDRDGLSDRAWQTFEMEGLRHSPALIPVLLFLFHRLEQRFGVVFRDPLTGEKRSRPTFLFLDEGWLFLSNSTFSSKIREWLKTLRKKNVAVIFATQSLADIAESPLAVSIMESCPTRIFLPNPAAFEDKSHKLYKAFGLNDRQVEIVRNATPKRDYYYQSPAGNRLFHLGLGPLALALCAGGSPNVLATVPRLLQEHGEEGFVSAYLREFGINEQQEGKELLSHEPS